MEIVILLVPLGLVLAGLAVAAFMWGLRRGQFEDLESRGWEVVFDDQASSRDRDSASASASAEEHAPEAIRDSSVGNIEEDTGEEPGNTHEGDRR